MNNMRNGVLRSGFTIVELLIIISVIAVLAAISIVSYNGIQKSAASAQTRAAISDAAKSLKVYNGLNKSYPSNLAATDYAPPLSVAMVMYTDATQTPVYSGMDNDQNAQLFLNICNAYMPITSGGVTYNTECVYSGKNLHAKGQVSTNVVIAGPLNSAADFKLKCGALCDTVQQSILDMFVAQGGYYPINVPKNGATLPPPTMKTAGVANTFCLEARSAAFDTVIYHQVPDSTGPEDGPCPVFSPPLHYP